MTDEAQLSRRGERKRQAAAKADACQKTKIASRRVGSVVRRARMILAVPEFVESLCKQKIKSIPLILSPRRLEPQSRDSDPDTSNEYLYDATLNFVIVWKFFHPYFSDPLISASLERLAPGFIQEMKDNFIALVIDGPFPLSKPRAGLPD